MTGFLRPFSKFWWRHLFYDRYPEYCFFCGFSKNSPPAMAILPSDVTVTDVVATTYITPAETWISWLGTELTNEKCDQLSSCTFVPDRVVIEASWGFFHSQPVPQREVIDGEQVVFVSRTQKISAGWDVSFRNHFVHQESGYNVVWVRLNDESMIREPSNLINKITTNQRTNSVLTLLPWFPPLHI